jgi:uncharacterized protein (TIGR03086 family)
MNQQELFLRADATLRTVVDQLTPELLALPAPTAWSRTSSPTLRDILASHAKDEAWVPDVVGGRTIEEVGDRWEGDLLGGDPIASYDRIHDVATAALAEPLDLDRVVHLSYGDFPLAVYFEHTTYYRTFQAWDIALLAGLDATLPDDLVAGVWALVESQLDDLRAIHVFGPEIPAPEGADAQTRLLCATGFWHD